MFNLIQELGRDKPEMLIRTFWEFGSIYIYYDGICL